MVDELITAVISLDSQMRFQLRVIPIVQLPAFGDTAAGKSIN
jgi:hypothetical protein